MKKYEWKMKSFAKKVDPDEAIQEIQKVENLFGKITPENVLKIASDKDSVLHSMFEWDDSKAARHYRLQQARLLINNVEIVIVSDGEERSLPVYEIVRVDEGQRYKHIESLTYDEVAQVRENTIKGLSSLKFKLSVYKQFDKVVRHLDLALEELG